MSIDIHSADEILSVPVSVLSDVQSIPDDLTNFKDLIEQTDNNGILQIYSYKYCDNLSPEEVKKIRGLVYNGEQRLFGSLGYTEEYTENDTKELANISFKNAIYFPSEEGTLIRVFSYDNIWYVSTNRRLDAFKSRWGCSKSFGEIFSEALLGNQNDSESVINNLTETLNKDHVYLFLVRNIEQNRIVSKAPLNNTVYHVGTLLNGKELCLKTKVLGVPSQSPLDFQYFDDVLGYVKNTDPFVRQGVIAFLEDGRQIKIINSKYHLYSQVRGNESSIKFRYLCVRNNPTFVRMIHELYPESIPIFSLYESLILKIAKKIHSAYIKRFINKEHTVVDKVSYRIIHEAHGRHIADRNFKVSLEVIISILSEQRFLSTLNFLIKQEIYPKIQ